MAGSAEDGEASFRDAGTADAGHREVVTDAGPRQRLLTEGNVSR